MREMLGKLLNKIYNFSLTKNNMPQKSLAVQPAKAPSLKAFFDSEQVKKKFTELLGQRSSAFMTSVVQAAMSNDMLKNADPVSIYGAAVVAATLNLPINPNLSFAYIIPYNNRKTGKQEAQFQIGYKGLIQLAQRSGLYETIAAAPVYEGQLVAQNPLEGYKFDFTKRTSDKVIGYAGYFKLLNGFHKTLFMSIDDLNAHAQRYSQTAKKGFGVWKDNFDAMATKTVIKLLLSKFGPLSIEMEKAMATDQAVVKNPDTLEVEAVEYVDNQQEVIKADLTSGLEVTGEKTEGGEQHEQT